MTSVLPTDLTEQALEATLDDIRAAVGAEHVLTDADDLREFRDPYWFAGWDDYEASAVVQPASVEELQAIVRVANDHGVPLWVSSQGRNNGYGGSSPRVRGAVVVNLRRMNRVLEIDGDAAYAVVEPGVSFFELYEAVRGSGHKLWISVPDLGWGSVIGNALEYGVGYTPYGEHANNVCGLEVLLPSGDLVRTGAGRHLERPRLACLQAELRAVVRRPLLPVEPRHRDAHGRVADARAGVLPAGLGDGVA